MNRKETVRVVAAEGGDGGVRLPRRALTALALSVAALLALSGGVAQASVPKLVPYGSFKSKGGYGVAVDQSSGDLYVAGFADFSTSPLTLGHIDKFDASGKELLLKFGEEVAYSGAGKPDQR